MAWDSIKLPSRGIPDLLVFIPPDLDFHMGSGHGTLMSMFACEGTDCAVCMH